MSKYDLLKSAGVAYHGYAFGSEETKQLWDEAVESVKDIKDARKDIVYGYNENTYIMDDEKIKGLHPVQILALAYGSALPFGGVVNGNRAKVYTD